MPQPTYQEIVSQQSLPLFKAIAGYSTFVTPNELSIYKMCGEAYRETGALPSLRFVDWARETLEKLKERAAKEGDSLTTKQTRDIVKS